MRNPIIQARTAASVLEQLPVFAPDPALWSRIQAEHRRRSAARYRRVGWIGAAAAAVFAVAVGVRLQAPTSVTAPVSASTLSEGQRESQALESQWQRAALAQPQNVGSLARLRVIDAALQSAYDRGAHEDELTPLWRQRNAALRGLIAGVQDQGIDPAGITRI